MGSWDHDGLFSVGDAVRSQTRRGRSYVAIVWDVDIMRDWYLLPLPEEIELMGDHHLLLSLEEVGPVEDIVVCCRFMRKSSPWGIVICYRC